MAVVVFIATTPIVVHILTTIQYRITMHQWVEQYIVPYIAALLFEIQ